MNLEFCFQISSSFVKLFFWYCHKSLTSLCETFWVCNLHSILLVKDVGVCLVAQSCLTVCSPTRLLGPWGFSRQEYWSELSCPPPGDLPNPGIELRSPALQADSLPSEPPGKPKRCGYFPLKTLFSLFFLFLIFLLSIGCRNCFCTFRRNSQKGKFTAINLGNEKKNYFMCKILIANFTKKCTTYSFKN